MLDTLERFAKSKPYCRPTNEQIADMAGLTPRYVGLVLQRMEAEGIILRVMDETSRKTLRLGVILRVRLDDSLPVADTPELVSQAAEALRGEPLPTPTHQQRRALFEAPSGRYSKRPVGRYSKRPLNSIDESCREENSEETKEADLRPRLQEPATPPAPRDSAAPPAPAAPCPAPVATPRVAPRVGGEPSPAPAELTPAQTGWLASLPEDRRRRFGELSESRRRQLLEGFRFGADRVAIAEAERTLGMSAPPPPPRLDTSPQELVQALAGRYGPSLAPQAARAVMTVLGDSERSWGPVHQLMTEVASGVRPVANVLDPLRKTLAEMAKGKQFLKGAAAYFMAGVRNWDRERGPEARKEPAFGCTVQSSPEGRPRPAVRPMGNCTLGATPCQL